MSRTENITETGSVNFRPVSTYYENRSDRMVRWLTDRGKMGEWVIDNWTLLDELTYNIQGAFGAFGALAEGQSKIAFRWLQDFSKSNSAVTAKRTLFSLAAGSVIGAIYGEYILQNNDFIRQYPAAGEGSLFASVIVGTSIGGAIGFASSSSPKV